MYMFPLGLGSAVSVRVSNALGAGLPHSAQRAAHTTMVLAALCQATLMAFVFASSSWWGRLFTDVEEVRCPRGQPVGAGQRGGGGHGGGSRVSVSGLARYSLMWSGRACLPSHSMVAPCPAPAPDCLAAPHPTT